MYSITFPGFDASFILIQSYYVDGDIPWYSHLLQVIFPILIVIFLSWMARSNQNYLDLACVGVRCLAFASACAQSWAAVSRLYDLCRNQVPTIIITTMMIIFITTLLYMIITIANGLYPTCLDVIDLEFDRNLVEFPILRAMQAPSFSPCAGASSAWATISGQDACWIVLSSLRYEHRWSAAYCMCCSLCSGVCFASGVLAFDRLKINN